MNEFTSITDLSFSENVNKTNMRFDHQQNEWILFILMVWLCAFHTGLTLFKENDWYDTRILNGADLSPSLYDRGSNILFFCQTCHEKGKQKYHIQEK